MSDIILTWEHIELHCESFKELRDILPVFEKVVSNQPLDDNERAFFITKILSECIHPRPTAAQILGKMGGLKGGAARAAALSSARRSEIARRSARARWDKKRRV